MEYGIPDMEATAEQMLTEGDQVHFSISDSDGNADVIVALKGEKNRYTRGLSRKRGFHSDGFKNRLLSGFRHGPPGKGGDLLYPDREKEE